MTASFEFNEGGKKKLLVFEVRHWMTNGEAGIGSRGDAPNAIGNIIATDTAPKITPLISPDITLDINSLIRIELQS